MHTGASLQGDAGKPGFKMAANSLVTNLASIARLLSSPECKAYEQSEILLTEAQRVSAHVVSCVAGRLCGQHWTSKVALHNAIIPNADTKIDARPLATEHSSVCSCESMSEVMPWNACTLMQISDIRL